jgi:hypothetical protein
MRRGIYHLLGAAIIAALAIGGVFASPMGAAPAQQAASCDGSGGVYLYESRNYTGRCLRFTQDVADLSAFTFNNQASSIRIVGDYTGVLYVDQNYGNVASAYGFDSSDLRGSVVDDNRASSLRVISGYRQTGDEICSGDGIYLYENTDFRGRCVRFNGDDSDFGDERFNNQASSARVIGNTSATLYVDQNYGGASVVISGNISNLNNTAVGNRAASSIRVGTTSGGANACNGSEGVYLYEHPNFQGRCVRFTGDAGDLRNVGFDDTASSIRLIGGWTATLFRDLNGAGASTTFTGDDANLADNPIGDNQATSLRAARGGTPPPPSGNACDGGEGVYLYEHPNYQGRCLKLTTGAGDLRVFGFDDTTSSIRLVGSWTVTLFRDLTGSGVSQVFQVSVPNLVNDPIGDNQATSVAVTRGTPPPPPPVGGNACDGGEGVYLYEHPNYQGRCLKLTTGAGDLRVFGFDDTASSIRLVGSWTATLFRDLTGSGTSQVFTTDVANLAGQPIGDNQATSVAVVRGGGGAPPPSGVGACDGSEGVYLYDGTDYSGACIRLTGDVADLRTAGFNDRVESVRVFGRWTTVLFRDLNFSGISSTYVESDSNLRNDGIGNNQATSIVVRRR